jgi:hypothetical protein
MKMHLNLGLPIRLIKMVPKMTSYDRLWNFCITFSSGDYKRPCSKSNINIEAVTFKITLIYQLRRYYAWNSGLFCLHIFFLKWRNYRGSSRNPKNYDHLGTARDGHGNAQSINFSFIHWLAISYRKTLSHLTKPGENYFTACCMQNCRQPYSIIQKLRHFYFRV